MSLVSMASPWNNDDIPKKKRLSTLRVNSKSVVPAMTSPDEYTTIDHNDFESSSNMQPASFDDLQQATTQRNRRVDELLNKITAIDANQENNKMGNFKPPENPIVQVRNDMDTKPPHAESDIELPSYLNATQKMRNVAIHNFSADDSQAVTFSNYNKSYEVPPVLAPYYSQQHHPRGAGMTTKDIHHDSKLMEKINYMIHMLEAQQLEKTSNITEEFILYTFLGVFIIYVVDSFARAGKYTR
jgi:hypothetical protein